MPLIDLNGLGHFKDKENAMIANDYSASSTYAVGDYVFYNGTLYKCKTAITTAEAWTSGHWEAAVLTDAVSELNTNLDVVYTGDESDIVQSNIELGNIAINTSGWAYSSSTTRVRTKQGYTIKLQKGDTIGLTSYSNATYYLGWKLSDGTYNRKGWNTADFVVEESGEYVFVVRNATEATVSDVSDLADLVFVKRTSLADLYDNEEKLNGIINLTENLILDSEEVDGYLYNNGTIVGATANKEKTTDYIAVTGGENLYLFVGMKASYWCVCCFYDSTKAIIGNRYYLGNDDDTIPVNGYNTKKIIIPTPTTASYIRISYRTLNGIYRYLARETVGTMSVFNGQTIKTGFNTIKSVAHKGYEMLYPENTCVSFWGAVKAGFNCVETDVRFTSDNVPVCLHDASINSTARDSDGTSLSSTINIADITYAEAQTYDFGYWKVGAVYKGITIPTFAEYLAICKNGGVEPYIEIKTGTSEQVKIVTDIVLEYGMADKCTFIGDTTILALVSTNLPKARLGYIVDTITSTAITEITALKTDDNEVFVDANYANLTGELVTLCVNAGVPLEAWTVNTKSAIASLPTYVTGITSGYFVPSEIVGNISY